MSKKILLVILGLTFIAGSALSWELTAELERNRVSIGNPVYLNITFDGSNDAPAPKVDQVEGLKIKYIGPASHISMVNGRARHSITFAYLIIPGESGEYRIGPFVTEHFGQEYIAPPVTLLVESVPAQDIPGGQGGPQPGGYAPGAGGGSSQPGGYNPVPGQGGSQPGGYGQAPGQLSHDPMGQSYANERVFLEMIVPRDEVYVNEAVPLTVKLYVKDMGLKDIEFPQFVYDGFSAEKWEEPEKTQEFVKGDQYNVLVFRRELFGIKEGEYTLGPAKLSAKAVVPRVVRRRSSMFGRSIFDDSYFNDMVGGGDMYPVEPVSGPKKIKIASFPEDGKPADFGGAVGDYQMAVTAEPRKVKIGDPVKVRMTITGSGNLSTVTCPVFGDLDGFKTYEPQVTKENNRKVYEQILIPKSEEISEIPAITFSFFDPGKKVYKTLTKEALPIEVEEQTEAEKAVKVVTAVPLTGAPDTPSQVFYSQEKLGEDILYIKTDLGKVKRKSVPLFTDPLFLAGHLIPLLMLIFAMVLVKQREKIRTDTRYARSLKAPAAARDGIKKAARFLDRKDRARFYDAVYKTLHDYLARRLGLPKGGVTIEGVREKLAGLDRDGTLVKTISDILSACDMARYASLDIMGHEEKQVFEDLKKIIDTLQKVKL